MEFKKMVLNKLFLAGVVCGFFIAGCLILGLKYNKIDNPESYQLSHLPQIKENRINDFKPQSSDKNVKLSVLKENHFAKKSHDESIEHPHSKIEMSNSEQFEDKVKPSGKGFVPIENQIVDVKWAPVFTNKLVDTFQLSDELYSLGIITAIECKTTLCEIKFDFNSPEDFNAVFKIRDAFKQTTLKKHGLVFDFLEKENMVKILVGRSDDSFVGIYQ
ncbi:hypothetical protein [Cognaticolwellia mytili]|uniref:hypothetical protein n=1 Tax=Cognaticolwellia mytili TaxID=1888913 RepID=UPI000A16FA24|nr:hypothetical protein [Cognaticolwellia mytili]